MDDIKATNLMPETGPATEQPEPLRKLVLPLASDHGPTHVTLDIPAPKVKVQTCRPVNDK